MTERNPAADDIRNLVNEYTVPGCEHIKAYEVGQVVLYYFKDWEEIGVIRSIDKNGICEITQLLTNEVTVVDLNKECHGAGITRPYWGTMLMDKLLNR